MTVEEAFEVLGLPEDADAKAIKRAYHQFLRRFKPDRDPVGFRRLRDAFEVASRMGPIELDTSTPSEILPPQSGLPDVEPVLTALRSADAQAAHAAVTTPQWAEAMLDSARLRHLTFQVGELCVLAAPDAYDHIASLYPEVFERAGGRLPYLLRVRPEWVAFERAHDVDPTVRRFVTQSLFLPRVERIELARAFGGWLLRDLPAAETTLTSMWTSDLHLGPFVMELVRGFDSEWFDDAASLGLPELPRPEKALTQVWLPLVVVAVALSVYAIIVTHGWIRAIGVVGFLVGAWHREGRPFHRTRVRHQYVKACILHDAAPWEQERRTGMGFLVQQDVMVEVCFRIGRLARLKLPETH